MNIKLSTILTVNIHLMMLLCFFLNFAFFTCPAQADPQEILWSRIANLPDDQHVACAAVIDDLVYMVGGQNPSGPPNYNKMLIYDPTTNSWSNGPPMPTRRYLPGAGVIDALGRKELYVVGGYSGFAGLSTVERYIPLQSTWEPVASISEPRGHGIMTAAVDNHLFAMGGFFNGPSYYYTNEMYDRQNNVWVQKTPITKDGQPLPMQQGLPTVWNDKIYIFGGHNRNGPLNNTLIYDPATDSWSEGEKIPRNRNGGRAITFGDYIYLIGGAGDSKIIDVYNPINDSWSTIDDYPGGNTSSPVISQSSNLAYLLGDNYNMPTKLECWVGQIEVSTDPPIADAGNDLIANANQQVTLDASNSYDPDGTIVRYTWKRLPDNVVIYSGSEPNCLTRALGRVEEIIELTVTDNLGVKAADTTKIINKTIADLLGAKFNHVPVADAGPDQTVFAWIDDIVEVTLDGTGSSDEDGQTLTYNWSWTINTDTFTATEANTTIKLPVGIHTIELIVNDGIDDSEPDEVVITVVPPMESQLWILPKVINRSSKMEKIMALVRLPGGIPKELIDSDELLVLYPGDIEAMNQYIIESHSASTLCVRVFAFFDKAELTDAVTDNGSVQLQTVGQLKTGRYFYGTDTVEIIDYKESD